MTAHVVPVDDHRERLGQLVKQQRKALRLTVKEATLAAGVSDTTWGKVEAGKPVGDDTLERIAHTIGWTEDSVAVVLAGGTPSLVEGAARKTDEDLLIGVVRELSQEVRLLRQALREGGIGPGGQ